MAIYDTDVQNGRAPMGPVATPQGVRAILVTADERLRTIVETTLQDPAAGVVLEGDILTSPVQLDPAQLERLRSADPQIVILDMSDDPERATHSAAQISAVVPRAALVGVGPDLDAPRLLEAMRAGVVEYLPRPLETVALSDAFSRIRRKNGWADASDGARDGELLAFFSAKGGSGATTVVTNLGIELHRRTGRKTLVVDLDLELGEIASFLGVQPRFHFVDLVRNFHRMDADLLPSYIEQHESGIHVLSAPFEPEIGEEVTGEHITRILGFLRSHYDYVLVDSSKSLAPPALAALQCADSIILITNVDVPSLRNLKRCLPILERVTAGDGDRIRLVVNRYNPKSLVRLEDLEETLGLEVFATLANDYETVIQSISTGQPLVVQSGAYSDQLRELAARLVAGPAVAADAKTSLVGRFLARFQPSPSPSRSQPSPLVAGAVEVQTHG